ncbi:hypothetical protein BDQ12DRAFT_619248 [Crucibulum laeve]|uniref:Kinesin light chain n=1 Tax=Crucibulum laeve TaxID=68775 RepID=A0A5C3LEQ5_9AGAR|nr:hypothetical protein BDQ12DRAFT_619248 [Crucibulum laeve]
MESLAVTYRNVGRYSEAETLVIWVMDKREKMLGIDHPHTLNAMENLAATYENLSRYSEA